MDPQLPDWRQRVIESKRTQNILRVLVVLGVGEQRSVASADSTPLSIERLFDLRMCDTEMHQPSDCSSSRPTCSSRQEVHVGDTKSSVWGSPGPCLLPPTETSRHKCAAAGAIMGDGVLTPVRAPPSACALLPLDTTLLVDAPKVTARAGSCLNC